MNCEIEISRNNVTVAQFIASVKQLCKAKGIDCSIETKEFKNPSVQHNTTYLFPTDSDTSKNYDNGKLTNFSYTREEAPCKCETVRTLPLDFQTYILNHDGSMFNEICEFTYTDNNKGYGYYYQVNKDA